MLHSKERIDMRDRRKEFVHKQLEQIAMLRQFKKDDDGGIIIFTIFLLISMLVLGGMAVDFMRLESARTKLQSVSDRAVLSAANLNQSREPGEVITDFFDTAGYLPNIVGTPTVTKTSSGSLVEVNSRVDIDTFYLRLIGIDTLGAPAKATAREGTGNVEISLVLDISGSMRNDVEGTYVNAEGVSITETNSKMFFLQNAATKFVDDMLLDDQGDLLFPDRISINLIAYSQQVSLGDELYKAIRTSPDSISEEDEDGVSRIGSSYLVDDDGYGIAPPDIDAEPDPDNPPPDPLEWSLGAQVSTNDSRCIDFDPADFAELEFDDRKVYDQVEYFDHYSGSNQDVLFPVCPERVEESILPLSQDAEELKRRINAYVPTSFTSIHLGMKWGVALLEPSMVNVLDRVRSIDLAFRGTRPVQYGESGTEKYLILMTDGVNVPARRIREDSYNTFEERERWKDWNLDSYVFTAGIQGDTRADYATEPPDTAFAQYNTWLQQQCDLARANGIIVYTIAYGDGAGVDEMRNCAFDPTYAFRTSLDSSDPDAASINDIFETIAARITPLRLSQ